MDYKEFSGKIKAKYPQYADMADEDLASKMVAKFPKQYGDVQLKDAPNSPAEAQDSPDDTMKYLAKMAKAIYGATPAGAITNLPALARGALGKEQPEGLSPTQFAAGAAGSAMRSAVPAAMRFAGENLDVMGGAGAGAMASLPFAPAAGPLAPLVPVAGALTGAMAARTAVRPLQAALGRPGAPYATADDLAQAGKEGAMQEIGGQVIAKGAKMGIEGAVALKASAVAKAKEILPDFGQVMLRIPSESINRTFERFHQFSPALKGVFNGPRRVAQVKADRIAESAFTELGGELSRARKIAGRRLEYAENLFVKNADDMPIVDAGDLNAAIAEWKIANPALAGSNGGHSMGMSDIQKIEAAVKRYTPKSSLETGIAAGQPITAKNAVALRREIDGLSAWNAGGVRNVENDAADRLAKEIGSYIRQNIKESAQKVGGKADYVKRLSEFSDLADKHDEALEILRTASGSEKAVAGKLKQLSSRFNEGGLGQEAILNIGKGVRGGERIQNAVQKLADSIAAREFTKVPAVVPSSIILRIINTIAPTRSAVSAAASGISGPASKPAAVGARSEVAARLAAALASQQTR